MQFMDAGKVVEALMEVSQRIAALESENMALREAMHDIYEVYAGSEGFPRPVTCAEAYLQERVKEMADIAAKHKRHGIRDTETPSSCLVGGAERMRVAAIKEDQ